MRGMPFEVTYQGRKQVDDRMGQGKSIRDPSTTPHRDHHQLPRPVNTIAAGPLGSELREPRPGLSIFLGLDHWQQSAHRLAGRSAATAGPNCTGQATAAAGRLELLDGEKTISKQRSNTYIYPVMPPQVCGHG